MHTILLVENDDDHANLVSRYFVDPTYILERASSADEALTMAKQLRPDLILLDIDLDDAVDGWEVNRRLKADPNMAAIPVIALTAHASRNVYRVRALAEGFADHIGKPIDFDLMFEIIRGYFVNQERTEYDH